MYVSVHRPPVLGFLFTWYGLLYSARVKRRFVLRHHVPVRRDGSEVFTFLPQKRNAPGANAVASARAAPSRGRGSEKIWRNLKGRNAILRPPRSETKHQPIQLSTGTLNVASAPSGHTMCEPRLLDRPHQDDQHLRSSRQSVSSSFCRKRWWKWREP